MANVNVRFYFGLQAKYDALVERDSMALYFITDTQRLYKGDILMATGANASSMAAGLMSAEDKIKLDSLVAGSGMDLSPVDGTIVISDGENGSKLIGVAIAPIEGNALTAVDGGLFVPAAKEVVIPEYAIEKQEVAEEGYASSYKLKKTVSGEVSYVGDTINVAKDMVLQSATMKTVSIAGVPYEGAEIGDPYIDMAFNDENASHIYLPVKGLVDSYTAGDGIEIVDNKISVKIAPVANGLVAVDGALSMNLATRTSAGAMSAADKLMLDSVPYVFGRKKYEVSSKPVGTLVNYFDEEIRVMCPSNTAWSLQNSGTGADPNSFYIGFKAYAPSDDVVSFKEDLAEIISDTTMYYFENNKSAGVDEFGRKYSIVWLPVAKHDDNGWTYHGINSSNGKYIGWYYSVEWYDADGVKVAADTIRINLSNEDCHNNALPYYMNSFATVSDVDALKSTVAAMGEAYTWGEL